MVLKLHIWLYRSLGANNGLLLTWINSKGVVTPLEIAQRTSSSNTVYLMGSYAATLGHYSQYGYTASNFPTIVSQLGNRVGWWRCLHCTDC